MQGDEPIRVERLTHCSWCKGEMPAERLKSKRVLLFCSKRCELDAAFWLLQEMCAIEVESGRLFGPTGANDDHCDSP